MIMALLFALGFFNNVAYSSVAGVSSQLPGKYSTLLLIGTGICGLVMSITREVMTVVFKTEEITGVITFFILSGLILIWAVALHLVFFRSTFYKDFLRRTSGDTKSDIEMNNVSVVSGDSATAPLRPKVKRDFGTLMTVLKDVKLPVFLLAVNFIQMFSMYPGVMMLKQMDGLSLSTKIVAMNMTFSIFYISGKKIGQYRKYYTINTVIMVVLLKFIFCACFVLQAGETTIPILNTTWFGFLNIVLFAMSTGFITCSLFIIGPEMVAPEQREISGFLSVLGVNTGVLTGTFTALPFKNL
jgi:hypothetical protein